MPSNHQLQAWRASFRVPMPGTGVWNNFDGLFRLRDYDCFRLLQNATRASRGVESINVFYPFCHYRDTFIHLLYTPGAFSLMRSAAFLGRRQEPLRATAIRTLPLSSPCVLPLPHRAVSRADHRLNTVPRFLPFRHMGLGNRGGDPRHRSGTTLCALDDGDMRLFPFGIVTKTPPGERLRAIVIQG